MCGIAGIAKSDPDAKVDSNELIAMRDSLWHRGPDGAGEIIIGPVGLAHRRLSIIDIAGGHQPMPNQQKSIWITYNGELYNYKELRAELQLAGRQFITNSDTEVIIQAYEHFGESCVEHLRGMFAFAIWDTNKQQLFLARDRLGIKPLYYAVTSNGILFGSEIKAILKSNCLSAEFNSSILPEYLATRFVSGEDTFFKGIKKLAPAHVLQWSAASGIKLTRYWQLPGTDKNFNLNQSDCIDMVRSGLEDAVRSHLVSDVPVGLFLSGGIDSTVLASIMAPMVDEPIHTFSVGFSEAVANELDYAKLAAEHIGARHREILVSPDQFFESLPQLIWHEDEPIAFTSSVPLHILSTLAQKHVKVVLTGEGADELFLGYDYRYRVTAMNLKLAKIYQAIVPGAARRWTACKVPTLPRQLKRYAERSFLAHGVGPRDAFFENFSVFRRAMREQLVEDQKLLSAEDPFAQGMEFFNRAGDEVLQCMSHTDLQTYLVELLMKQDQMSMAASIESRVPFLDHLLVETIAAIPGPRKIKGMQTKVLLREATKDLIPPQILKRKKMGFPVPTDAWLRGPYWQMVEEFVLSGRARDRSLFNPAYIERISAEHRKGSVNHGDRLWLLINLEIWQRLFIDGAEISDIMAIDKFKSGSSRIKLPPEAA